MDDYGILPLYWTQKRHQNLSQYFEISIFEGFLRSFQSRFAEHTWESRTRSGSESCGKSLEKRNFEILG
jgi:hypothetical protein